MVKINDKLAGWGSLPERNKNESRSFWFSLIVQLLVFAGLWYFDPGLINADLIAISGMIIIQEYRYLKFRKTIAEISRRVD
jgi:hypothetical protein